MKDESTGRQKDAPTEPNIAPPAAPAPAQATGRELRERFAAKRRRLLHEVTSVLGEDDRMGIIIGPNTDEYDIEAHNIVKELYRCRTEADVARLVCDEYDRMFSIAGSPESYAQVARTVWGLWQECLRDDAAAWSLLDEAGQATGHSDCISTSSSCPKCKTKTQVFIWRCVNGADDPSLRDDLLEGRLNVAKCAACGEESPLGDDLLYFDARRGYCVRYCSLWMERLDDPLFQDGHFKLDFTKDAKPTTSLWPSGSEPPPGMADPHVVLDMGELRRYIRLRDRLFDLYERLGDETFPPREEPKVPPRNPSRHVVRVFDPNRDPSVAERLKDNQERDPRVVGLRTVCRWGLVETPKGTYYLDDDGNGVTIPIEEGETIIIRFVFDCDKDGEIGPSWCSYPSFSLAECRALLTGEDIPLHDFIKRGHLSDQNYEDWDAALSGKPVEEGRNVIDDDSFGEWGAAAAAKMGVSIETINHFDKYMRSGICMSKTRNRLVRQGLMGRSEMTKEGEAVFDEVAAARLRWINGLPPDADVSFVKRECSFEAGDIVGFEERRYMVFRNTGYWGTVMDYPAKAGRRPRFLDACWMRGGKLCRKVGHEEIPTKWPWTYTTTDPQGGTRDGAGQD